MLNADELKIFLMRRAGFLREFVDRRIHKRHRAMIAPEDILQDVFIAAFRKRATFVPLAPNSLDKWLQRIAERRLSNAHRDARAAKRGGPDNINRRLESRSSYLDLIQIVGNQRQRTPSSEAVARESVAEVQVAMADLPEDCCSAVTLFHIQGHTRAEVAKRMGKTPAAINSLVYRGLAKLREQMVET